MNETLNGINSLNNLESLNGNILVVIVGLIESLEGYKGIPQANIIIIICGVHGIPPSQFENVIYGYMEIFYL